MSEPQNKRLRTTEKKWWVCERLMEDPEVVCHWCAYPEEFDVIHDDCLDKVQEASRGLKDSLCSWFIKEYRGDGRVVCRSE